MRALPFLLLLLTGCAAASGAAINIAVGAGVAAARRSNGECYTPCNPGTTCNAGTGECDPIPCKGECRPEEECVGSGLSERCVPHVELELRTTSDRGLTTPLPPSPPDGGPTPADVPRSSEGVPGLEPRR